MTAVYNLRGNAPVVILDDIVSELDEKRKHNLLGVIANLGIQAFLSANDVSHFPGRLSEHQIFSVNEGKILAFLNS
jgi:DNA replication and repair protein RecF